MEEIFLLCDEEGVRTRVVVDFFPHVNSQVYLDRLGSTPLLTFSAAPHDEIRLLLKRVTDILLAGAALVLLLPFMLLIALLIPLTSPGPAIFRQERCGLNGRRFVFYKFRSMCDNAEELKASLAHLEQEIHGLQDSERSTAHQAGLVPAQIFDRRVAAVVERAQGGHVAGGSAPGRSRGSGPLSALAAPPAADASGSDLPVGGGGTRCAGFRDLDENGHAIHRHMVIGARLEDNPAHDPAGAYGAWSELGAENYTRLCIWYLHKTKWSACCAARARFATAILSIPMDCTPPNTCRCNLRCAITSTPKY